VTIIDRIVREPQAIVALLTLLVAAGGIFDWWTLTPQQYEWVLAVIGAVILVLRQYVTPVHDPNLPIGTIVNANTDSQPTGVVVVKPE
jgi:hypothetical protein